MKLFHKRGGGVNRISYLLFRTAYVFRNTVKVLNKGFIKAVRGEVKVLWNFFIKFCFFLNDGFPKGHFDISGFWDLQIKCKISRSLFVAWDNWRESSNFSTTVMQRNLKFLHITDLFSTDTACDACDKYDVWEGVHRAVTGESRIWKLYGWISTWGRVLTGPPWRSSSWSGWSSASCSPSWKDNNYEIFSKLMREKIVFLMGGKAGLMFLSWSSLLLNHCCFFIWNNVTLSIQHQFYFSNALLNQKLFPFFRYGK